MSKTRGAAVDPVALNRPGAKIFWFDDLGTGNERFRFLSNFYEGDPLVMPGTVVEYRTGEHAFQAYKTKDEDLRFDISAQPTPNGAKSLGRSVLLRPDWERVKYDVMCMVVRTKFSPGRKEAELLLATQDAYLCEGTFWRDRVWGVDLQAGPQAGRNWLGTILMARRAELRAHRDFGVAIPDGSQNLRYCE